MERLLQSKVNYKTMHKKRSEMIKEEKLHISDSISYSRFQELYQKYGEGLTEEEFARYFLDIDGGGYYNLQSGIIRESIILEREFYLDYEFDEIEEIVREETGLGLNAKIDYETLVIFHNTYGGRFSLKMFAYEIFGINAHNVENLKVKKGSSARISKNREYDRNVIREIRRKLETEPGLHIKSLITLERFEELYKKYGEGILDERVFALKVLDITGRTFLKFKNGKRPQVTIWGTYPLNPNYILEIRKRLILTEELNINGSITIEKFDELYQKYGGILTETLFAQEVLDVTYTTLSVARRKKYNLTILGDADISEDYIDELRTRIIDENDFYLNQLKTLKELKDLYLKYGYPLSEKYFIISVLGVSENSYYLLMAGSISNTHILVGEKNHDFETIRRKVIAENNLHYDDVIDYVRFRELYSKYGMGMREHVFANKILDIDQARLANIRKGFNTYILLAESLPYEDEIKDIRARVIEKYSLSSNSLINYKLFKQIYEEFGGIMPEDMFAYRVLEISVSTLKQIRENVSDNIYVFRMKDILEENINEIRFRVFMKHRICTGYRITLQQLEVFYKDYKSMSLEEFALRILRISESSLLRLKSGEREDIILSKSIGMNEKQIVDLRTRVLVDNNLCLRSILDYNAIRKLYNSYEHTLTEVEFSLEILGISSWMLAQLKQDSEKSTEIWKENRVKEEKNGGFYLNELEEVKKCIKDGFCVREIAAIILHSVNWVERAIRHLQSKNQIDIDEWKTKIVMRFYLLNRTAYEINKITGIPIEHIKDIIKTVEKDTKARKLKEEEITRLKRNHGLQQRVKIILDRFGDVTEKSISVIKEYIAECNKRYEYNILTMEEVIILGEAIEFIQGGKDDIALFARACCISFKKYKEAYVFILRNIDNEGISSADKEELEGLIKSIHKGMRIEEAINMIRLGTRNIQEIARRTRLLENEVIDLMKLELGTEHILSSITSNYSTLPNYLTSPDDAEGYAPEDK